MQSEHTVWGFVYRAALAALALRRGDAEQARSLAKEAWRVAGELKLTRDYHDPSVRSALEQVERLRDA